MRRYSGRPSHVDFCRFILNPSSGRNAFHYSLSVGPSLRLNIISCATFLEERRRRHLLPPPYSTVSLGASGYLKVSGTVALFKVRVTRLSSFADGLRIPVIDIKGVTI